VIALPPLLAGGVNVTVNGPAVPAVAPVTAFTAVGAPGRFASVTGFDGPDAGPLPTAFDAVTEHV
jgi:hypothetical protein